MKWVTEVRSRLDAGVDGNKKTRGPGLTVDGNLFRDSIGRCWIWVV